MPTITIIIPHKRAPANDVSLKINIDALLRNTVNSYELVVDTEVPKDPYKIWNEAAEHARSDILVFTNSDVIMAPGWDVNFVKYMAYNTYVTGYLVEPGNIGVASVNIHKSFGKTPNDFQVWDFEKWAMNQDPPEKLDHIQGWYMPCAVNRIWFLDVGRFNTDIAFPNPNDGLFWDMCIAKHRTNFVRVRSFAYHFQCLSSR